MGKTLACFEVTNDSIRLLLGYEEEHVPVLLYSSEVQIPDIISRGMVADEDALVAALSPFHKIVDDHAKLDVSITTVNVVLPSVGFQAFRGAKTTNTVSPTVSLVDVSNVISLLQKEAQKEGYTVIDIIPQEFVLEDGRRFSEPPIGEASSTLTVSAFVHVLPTEVCDPYTKCFLRAGFRVEKISVASYCEGLALGIDQMLPKNALLVNLGAKITTVNLIMEGMSLACQPFYFGGDDLTAKIVEGLGIPFEAAEGLKKKYGYDPRNRIFRAPIYTSDNPVKGKIYQTDLNDILLPAMQTYGQQIKDALNYMKQIAPQSADYPVVLAGGTSLLPGIEKMLGAALPGYSLLFYRPVVVGIRPSTRYMALLGLLLAPSSSSGGLSDNQKNLPHVSRPVPKDRRVKRSGDPEDDSL